MRGGGSEQQAWLRHRPQEAQYVRYSDAKTRFPVPDWLDQLLKSQPVSTHSETLNDPSAKFIVATCYRHSHNQLEACGGLTDRLFLLPYMLWLAHKTGRRFLIKYFKPRALEDFLVPPAGGFEWRLPDGHFEEELEKYANRSAKEYGADRRRVWHSAIERAPYMHRRVIFINSNLAIPAAGKWEPWAHNGSSTEDLWPGLFRRMFKPSAGLAKAMSPIVQKYELRAGSYAAAHLRVRYLMRSNGNGGIGWSVPWYRADKNDRARINMTDGRTRQLVGMLADHAVECAVRVMPTTRWVYVAADASEVILESNLHLAILPCHTYPWDRRQCHALFLVECNVTHSGDRVSGPLESVLGCERHARPHTSLEGRQSRVYQQRRSNATWVGRGTLGGASQSQSDREAGLSGRTAPFRCQDLEERGRGVFDLCGPLAHGACQMPFDRRRWVRTLGVGSVWQPQKVCFPPPGRSRCFAVLCDSCRTAGVEVCASDPKGIAMLPMAVLACLFLGLHCTRAHPLGTCAMQW